MPARHRIRIRGVLPLAIALAVAAMLHASPLSAQGTGMKEDAPGLLKKALITPDSARALAQSRVPRGTIAEQEIEMEDGLLVYSFDMKVPDRSGIDEVVVNARTGKVVSVSHETPKAQAAEKAADAKEARAKKKSP